MLLRRFPLVASAAIGAASANFTPQQEPPANILFGLADNPLLDPLLYTQTMTGSHHFKTVTFFQTTYSTSTVTKYASERTGMTVVVVDREGPKVHGYFALATEIHDNSGAPHTLEHLIFMGSKNYKYKGVLDQLATRAYAETNAWTATDHTAYTMDCAGWEGFRQILPVYLEHVLFPTLTDEGCMTEVYHIDGSGQDAGVVYAEMQGVQNTQESLMDEEARQMLYPEGQGFRYETGGLMEALRVLTTKRIRDFHKEMYQPKNLCVVVVGTVDHSELLETMEKFEDGVVDFVPAVDDAWRRFRCTFCPHPRRTCLLTLPDEDLGLSRTLCRS